MSENILCYGDNLDILRHHVEEASVDLVYLDPPFKSKKNYNVLFQERNGSWSKAQIKAFGDTWRWDQGTEEHYVEIVEQAPDKVSRAVQALRHLLGRNDMMAYLVEMALRLVELRRVLKSTGTVYLHCDPVASHYLKVIMDALFGPRNFRNEIVWCYAGGGIPKNDFPRKHDIILRYTKSDNYLYQPVYREYSPGTVERGRTKVKGKYAELGLRKEGTPVNDWWADVPKITSPTDPEKLGYPTQKSEALLERILEASTQQGNWVLDPFCGCGTTIAVAQRLRLNWIGIDITHLAVALIKSRLKDAFGDDVSYRVIGEPVSLPDAETLAKEDPYQFQFWALGLVGARPSQEKKGADRGVDGRRYFHDETEPGKTKQMVVQVKGGNVTVAHVRDLAGVIRREHAEIGVLITLREPTNAMRAEAAAAGFYEPPGWGKRYPRLQLRTIQELFDGKKLEFPWRGQRNATFKKAPNSRIKGRAYQRTLLLE